MVPRPPITICERGHQRAKRVFVERLITVNKAANPSGIKINSAQLRIMAINSCCQSMVSVFESDMLNLP